MKPSLILLALTITTATAQTTPRPLISISGHYKTLSLIDHKPNASRAAFDALRFPMQDASKGSFFCGPDPMLWRPDCNPSRSPVTQPTRVGIRQLHLLMPT